MQHLMEICYLIGSFGFIIGLKLMGQPDSKEIWWLHLVWDWLSLELYS